MAMSGDHRQEAASSDLFEGHERPGPAMRLSSASICPSSRSSRRACKDPSLISCPRWCGRLTKKQNKLHWAADWAFLFLSLYSFHSLYPKYSSPAYLHVQNHLVFTTPLSRNWHHETFPNSLSHPKSTQTMKSCGNFKRSVRTPPLPLGSLQSTQRDNKLTKKRTSPFGIQCQEELWRS